MTVLVLGVVLGGTAGCGSSTVRPAASPSTSAELSGHLSIERLHRQASSEVLEVSPGRLQSRGQAALGAADGVLPDGVTVFDDTQPAVVNLDPTLLEALRRAAEDAESDGVEFSVNSGWRSEEYQKQLFERAVGEYGSEAEAARWVARPGTSVHEAGGAVDLGPHDAQEWLSDHGAGYGLCQIYRNEPWHFELRPAAIDQGCPAMYVDPTEDPRMPT